MLLSEQIRLLCRKENISVAELARRLHQTPQNFGKKLKRNTLTQEECAAIAASVGAEYEQHFRLSSGEIIK